MATALSYAAAPVLIWLSLMVRRSASASRRRGALCRISITDHGPGIPLDIRDQIFTPFFTTKRRGTGLGLPTAKRFIEAHEGQISIVCPPSGGTTVTVQLPAN